MRSRLPLCPSEVAAVAKSAPCCHASVVRWLHGVDGNQGTDKLIRAALEELDLHPTRMDPMARVDRETRQLVMPAVDTPPDNPPATPRGESGNGGQFGAGHQPHKRLVGESPNMGQPGDARSCPVGLDDSMSPTPTTPAGRSASIQRCRVRCELLDGTAVSADERPGHWWEERESEVTP